MATREYGSWSSAITAELVVEAAVSLGEVVAGQDDIWWSELRPQEGGRVMVVRHEPGGRDVDVLPEGWSARTRVHEYGGGAWWLHDDSLFFANWADQRLYRIDPDTEPGTFLAPVALTPEPAQPQGDRYADGVLSADGHWVICVRERHEPGAGEARNEIVALEAEPSGPPSEPVVLVSGPDFVAAPRVSPDGSRLCWIQWHHPDMPWDGTELVVADLVAETGDCRVSAPTVVAGSRDESVGQPEWHADGSLWFLSDRSNWWNLYRIDAEGVVVPVAPIEAEIGVPHWVFGQSRYAFLPDGRVAVAYASGGLDHLAVITPGRPPAAPTPGRRPTCWWTWRRTSWPWRRCAPTATAWCSWAARPSARRWWRWPTSQPTATPPSASSGPDGRWGWVPSGSPNPDRCASSWRTAPTPTPCSTPRPTPRPAVPEGSAPPLLVLSHGGPTSAARPQLSLSIQYWTSRGFAVVDVNYRGSTGYGREYRQALAGQWGVADVDDCVAVARHLADAGLVDRQRLAIRGAAPVATPPWPRWPSATSSGPAPASTAWPISRPWPATPTSSSPATSTPWWVRSRPRPTATGNGRPSTTWMASTARCWCCRAWRTRSCPRLSPR